MHLGRVSIGLPGATDHAVIARVAPRIEELGFRALWLNDTPQGDSLEGLAVAASVTTRLVLATGVIPLDRRPAAEIAGSLSGLPLDRLEIGVGAGGPTDALSRVRDGVTLLRRSTPAAILVGGLGPRMRALGAELADGLLLNWLTPEAAAAQRSALVEPVSTILYARAALDPDALPALEAEAARYGSYPPYAANFERIGASPLQTTITDRAGIRRYLGAVDELVLRVVTREQTLEAYEEFLRAVQ